MSDWADSLLRMKMNPKSHSFLHSDALVIASFKLLSSHELLPDVLSLKNIAENLSMLKKPIKNMYFWKGYWYCSTCVLVYARRWKTFLVFLKKQGHWPCGYCQSPAGPWGSPFKAGLAQRCLHGSYLNVTYRPKLVIRTHRFCAEEKNHLWRAIISS